MASEKQSCLQWSLTEIFILITRMLTTFRSKHKYLCVKLTTVTFVLVRFQVESSNHHYTLNVFLLILTSGPAV